MLGELRHRIILQRPKRISNGRGGWSINYEAGDQIEVWAAADILTIDQQLRYQEHQEAANMQFTIRATAFIDTDTRIIYNGKNYNIEQMAPAHIRFLEIRAREV